MTIYCSNCFKFLINRIFLKFRLDIYTSNLLVCTFDSMHIIFFLNKNIITQFVYSYSSPQQFRKLLLIKKSSLNPITIRILRRYTRRKPFCQRRRPFREQPTETTTIIINNRRCKNDSFVVGFFFFFIAPLGVLQDRISSGVRLRPRIRFFGAEKDKNVFARSE